MTVLQDGNQRLAFGRFEVNLQTGELWKGHLRIRLPAQPFKVLSTLLERPGEVVTREALQQRLWGKDTNVDYERALAGAINKIRDALGDSAENPRFIETLPKRGYRFVAPVTVVALGGESAWSEPARFAPAIAPVFLSPGPSGIDQALAHVVEPAIAASELPVQPQILPQIRSRMSAREWALLGAGALLLVATILLSLLALQRRTATLPEVEELTYDSPIAEGPPNSENLPSLATDGDRILATTLLDGATRLGAFSLGNREMGRVELPRELASVSITDISREGSRLLVLNRLSSSSEQPLWMVPTSGRSAWRVGDVLAHDATWMPDGASVLYASGNDLTVFRLADGTSTRLVSLPGRAFWPRWSPDGKLLRFTVIDPVTHWSELWEMAAGSREPHPLAGTGESHAPTCCGVWTADGKNYIFVRSWERRSDLWSLGRGAFGSLVQLTHGPIRYFSPVPARVGARVFFLGADSPVGLQRCSSTQRECTTAPPFLRSANRVAYSRNGAWVAWTDANEVLWRARAADGSDRLQLSPSQLEVFSAEWSPDGTRLAVMARTPGHAWSIYLVGASGGQMEHVLDDNRNAADPTWSPDGRELSFGREPDAMGKESGPRQIYVLELATRSVRALPGSDDLFSPRWSPDGRWIVALGLDQKKVMLYDMTARSWRQLAATSAADPSWSHDSKSLFVHAFLADKQPILRISVPTGDMQVVTDLSALITKGAGNYFFSGVTPANEPLLLSRIGTSNVFALDLDR
jgi:Tol biopolymer transport system component/DNA-binding winged helix-turn-helix (wHTH) protein